MVSLIICTRNRPDMLKSTINIILEGTMLPSELIIVDQSDEPNHDLSRMIREDISFIYRWSEKKGLSLGNNLGVALARNEILIFTHDDVKVAKDWLETIVNALIKLGENVVVTGRILAESNSDPQTYTPSLRTEIRPATYSGKIDIDVLKPLNMGFFRNALEKVGGFDERLGPGTNFPGAEDSDLGYRFLKNGFKITYVPEAVVYHMAWRKRNEYLQIRWGYGFSQGAFLAKHFQEDYWHITKRFLLDLQRRAIRFLRRVWHDPLIALGDPTFIVGNIAGAVAWVWLRSKERINAKLQ